MVCVPKAGSLFWGFQKEFIVLAKYVFYFGSFHLFSIFPCQGVLVHLSAETLIRDAIPQLINAAVLPLLYSVVLEVQKHGCANVLFVCALGLHKSRFYRICTLQLGVTLAYYWPVEILLWFVE